MLQKVDDSPLKKCVKCEGKVERLVSSPAIQFKGTGWYVTDYARKGQRPPETEKSSDSSSSKDATSKKSRSKESGPATTASSTSKA